MAAIVSEKLNMWTKYALKEDEDVLLKTIFCIGGCLSGDHLGHVFCLLKLKQLLVKDVDEDVKNLKRIAEEDGADPRLRKLVNCFPIETALRRGLQGYEEECSDLSTISLKIGLYLDNEEGSSVDIILKRVPVHCQDEDPSDRCLKCEEVFVAEPFFKMFGLVSELEKVFKMKPRDFKDFPGLVVAPRYGYRENGSMDSEVCLATRQHGRPPHLLRPRNHQRRHNPGLRRCPYG